MGLAEAEKEAGRTGGKEGPQIHYDDAAIERLLDRCSFSFPQFQISSSILPLLDHDRAFLA